MKVIAYTRVSTIEQANSGAGLAAQESAIKGRASSSGWEIVRVASDAGVSGSVLPTVRPQLGPVLEALKRGEADALVVAKLDRLSRSLLDFASLMETAKKQGWAIVALDLGVDTTTPAGKMMANVLASFAQYEREIIGQRTKEALAQKKAEGVELGRPKEVSAEAVATIHHLRAEGRTLQAIADVLTTANIPTAHGGARWYPSTVAHVLKSA